MSNIYLCGFMGCGKTLIAKRLATALRMKYTDLDKYICLKEGMTIPEIFNQKGESHFRQLEYDYIQEIKNTVVATGGGALITDKVAEYAKSNGTVVFLDADFETCYARIKDDLNRPLVQNNTKEQLENLFNKRREIYKKNSTITVSADGAPKRITDTIAQFIIHNS